MISIFTSPLAQVHRCHICGTYSSYPHTKVYNGPLSSMCWLPVSVLRFVEVPPNVHSRKISRWNTPAAATVFSEENWPNYLVMSNTASNVQFGYSFSGIISVLGFSDIQILINYPETWSFASFKYNHDCLKTAQARERVTLCMHLDICSVHL